MSDSIYARTCTTCGHTINDHDANECWTRTQGETMTTSDYITRRYGSNRNRHWWGIAHRRWLLNSGRYIKTSQQRGMGLMQFIAGPLPEYKPIGEGGPELVNFRPGGVVPSPKGVMRDPRMTPQPGEHIIHPDGRAWTVGDRAYPPPHHRGAALWMPSEPGSRHWPGCGCP